MLSTSPVILDYHSKPLLKIPMVSTVSVSAALLLPGTGSVRPTAGATVAVFWSGPEKLADTLQAAV